MDFGVGEVVWDFGVNFTVQNPTTGEAPRGPRRSNQTFSLLVRARPQTLAPCASTGRDVGGEADSERLHERDFALCGDASGLRVGG